MAKQKYALGETSSKVTSHPKDPQPRLIQLPLLPQDGSQVGHGGERVRVQRAEVRFVPLEEVIGAHLGLLFAGVQVIGWHLIRVLRSAEGGTPGEAAEDTSQP